MDTNGTNNQRENLSINSFDFFLFLLKKLKIKPSEFCDENGWNPETYHMWKSVGVPKRAWKTARRELVLHNALKFHERLKDEFVYFKEAETEYLNKENNIN